MNNVYECISFKCTNKSDQGNGKILGHITSTLEIKTNWICSPCYEFLIKGLGVHSQIYRNAQKENKL